MKKRISLSLLLAAVMFVSASYARETRTPAPDGPQSPAFNSTTDSLSYAMGLDLGNYIKNMSETIGNQLNVSVVAAAISDVADGCELWTSEESMAFLQDYFINRRPKELKKAADDFLADFRRNNPDFAVTESGLVYRIEKQGNMRQRAKDNADQVKVNYTGTLTDGTEFDRGEDITFELNRVIPGWAEGMKLIGKGGKIRLVIPPDLGYGERGNGTEIPPYAVLIFDVEVLDVIPAPKEDPEKSKKPWK